MAKRKQVKCAVIGYGGAFNMGRHHAEAIESTPGLKLVAICDVDKARAKVAASDFPKVETYTKVSKLLKDSDAELCVLVVPHNLHAPVALQCLKAGRHVITEKPMCITVAEADKMIAAAKKQKVMLSVFHNRRWDGDFRAIRDVIQRGLLGEVFRVEAFFGGYGHPGHWWRSDKEISGGAMYDWGAHFLDWVLHLVPEPIESVTGFVHKLVWKDVTNEDSVIAVIKFENGAVAEVEQSSIALAGKPKWRILGTEGAIVDHSQGAFELIRYVDGLKMSTQVKYQQSDWHAYYRNVAAHLLKGEPLEVTAEDGRRVIAVIETAEKSAAAGTTLTPPVP